jgi:peptidoglycan/xylan/chitin deacetylase (PgdA/CDA1 family)
MSEDAAEQEVSAPPAGTAPVAAETRRAWLAVNLAATVLLGAVLAYGPMPVPVTIDGTHTWVLRGATATRLARQGRLAGKAGNLVSLSKRILVPGGGAPPEIDVNGTTAGMGANLDSGVTITSYLGADVVEPTVTRTIETTPAVIYKGVGPVETVEDPGTPGTAEVVVGAVSGEEQSRRVISAGAPMTIRREAAWTGSKRVALTFDDGPWNSSTDAVLAILKSNGVKATFFMVGSAVNRRPAIARRVLAAGMEIGNHTQSHRSLRHLPQKAVSTQIRRGALTIRRTLGIHVLWFRPPGGAWDATVKHEVRAQHERLVLWSVDPKDWSRPGERVIAARILDRVQPGSIVLMHDGGGDRSQTVAALGLVIASLKARGYSMVTLGQLFGVSDAPVAPALRIPVPWAGF